MIECIDRNVNPSIKSVITTNHIMDKNSFVWVIKRTEDKIYLRYDGDAYFSDSYIEYTSANGKTVLVDNTNNYLIHDNSDDTYNKIVDAINLGYTDDIFEELISDMFNHVESK